MQISYAGSTAQHSTAQHSTAQHSTAQHLARRAVQFKAVNDWAGTPMPEVGEYLIVKNDHSGGYSVITNNGPRAQPAWQFKTWTAHNAADILKISQQFFNNASWIDDSQEVIQNNYAPVDRLQKLGAINLPN